MAKIFGFAFYTLFSVAQFFLIVLGVIKLVELYDLPQRPEFVLLGYFLGLLSVLLPHYFPSIALVRKPRRNPAAALVEH
jgi:hypothetical protein